MKIRMTVNKDVVNEVKALCYEKSIDIHINEISDEYCICFPHPASSSRKHIPSCGVGRAHKWVLMMLQGSLIAIE